MKKEFLECGKIINTHGIAGAVKAEPWCDTPQVLAALKTVYFADGGEYRPVEVINASVFKSFVILTLSGIGDIDSAAALRGSVLYAARADIVSEAGAVFIADLIGLEVIDDRDGRVYGKITDVINSGASDIYVIETPNGERMMPAVKEFVRRVDLDSGVYVAPISGMLD